MPKTLKGVQTCFSIAFNNRCTNPFAVFIRSPWTLALSSLKMSKHPGSFYGLRERNEMQCSIVLKNSKRRFSIALHNRFTEPFALLFPSSWQCPFSSTQTLKRSGLFCIFGNETIVTLKTAFFGHKHRLSSHSPIVAPNVSCCGLPHLRMSLYCLQTP